MKHKKWLFPILSAAVALVAVVAIWINIGPEEPSGEKVIKDPKITFVVSATKEPSGETVVKAPKITFVASATKEPSGETVIIHIDYVDITSSIETLSENADVIVIGTIRDVAHAGRGGATYRFDVEETLKGEVADSIHVVRTAPPESTDIPPPYVVGDITSSIETLSENADVIVIGTIRDVAHSWPRMGARHAVHRFDVEETLKGEVARIAAPCRSYRLRPALGKM